MIVNDPQSPTTIDVTGWDLDYLYGHISTVAFDVNAGNVREISDDEAEVLGLTYADTGLPSVDWTTGHRRVVEAVEHLRPIVDEAIFQRDLDGALTRKAQGASLSPAQELAYDRYVRELAYR
jgi:hypothetical protein